MPKTLEEYQRRARRLNPKHLEADFFRFLKKHKRKELLNMQNEQLFRMPSEGKDGVRLGNYEKVNRQAYTGLIRPAGSPFWMENTGELKEKMRVKIFIGRQEIVFENKRKDVDKPWFRYNTDIYATSEWFGLNEENFAILQEWGRRFMEIWTKNMIDHGTRTTSTNLI